MTTIEATCPSCGTIERTPADFELAVCDDPSASWYAFGCPSCNERIQKHADERVIALLIAEGVAPIRWRLPMELLEGHDGPPITLDDVLDFHLLLEQPGWFLKVNEQTASPHS